MGSKSRLDTASFLGLLIAIGGIIGGLILEGGHISELAQPTGALIVFGGTLGAVLITTPMSVVMRAIKKSSLIFLEPVYSPSSVLDSILGFALKARRSGMVSLENEVDDVDSAFLRKALNLAVDGTDVHEIRSTMELEILAEEEEARAEAKVYEAAGGYSPTIGIIGAVLGLIQVMQNLQDIDKVGQGIAVAFVATVYGVGAANLLFLPAASKLKARSETASRLKEMMVEGVCAIAQGLHPKVIERKLEAYVSASSPKAQRESRGQMRAQPARAR